VTHSKPVNASGTLIAGRWELKEQIGSGAVAAVYRAVDTTDGSIRAIKLLDPSLTDEFGYRSRFVSEGKAMSRMHHPNIARVFAYGEAENHLYTVMEYASGGTVLDHLNGGERYRTLPAMRIIFEVLQALAVAHREGVIHRDVKPSNVLFSEDGGVRLADFGIARFLDDKVPHRTISGASMGTLGYMAPEQGKNARHVGKTVDLYAAGATLYVMLVRKNPLSLAGADSNPDILLKLPLPVRLLIGKACSYKVDGRYKTARKMAYDLAGARDVIGGARGEPRVADTWMAEFDRLTTGPL